MNATAAEKWKKTRAKGRKRFVWITGVIFWGLTTGVLWSFAMAAFQGWQHLSTLLPIALIAFPIGGYCFGASLWKKTEERYAKHLSQHTDS